jgi:hypothetical protein
MPAILRVFPVLTAAALCLSACATPAKGLHNLTQEVEPDKSRNAILIMGIPYHTFHVTSLDDKKVQGDPHKILITPGKHRMTLEKSVSRVVKILDAQAGHIYALEMPKSGFTLNPGADIVFRDVTSHDCCQSVATDPLLSP